MFRILYQFPSSNLKLKNPIQFRETLKKTWLQWLGKCIDNSTKKPLGKYLQRGFILFILFYSQYWQVQQQVTWKRALNQTPRLSCVTHTSNIRRRPKSYWYNEGSIAKNLWRKKYNTRYLSQLSFVQFYLKQFSKSLIYIKAMENNFVGVLTQIHEYKC
jgi:hypothetical protein